MFLTCKSGFRLLNVGVGLVCGTDVVSSFTKRGFLAGWSFASIVSVKFSGFLIKGGLKGLKTMAACNVGSLERRVWQEDAEVERVVT
jgi:hypothetical protein